MLPFGANSFFLDPFSEGRQNNFDRVASLESVSIILNCLCFTDINYFVCVEVLRPSQPNGVMSSAVSLPNHTFTGQA